MPPTTRRRPALLPSAQKQSRRRSSKMAAPPPAVQQRPLKRSNSTTTSASCKHNRRAEATTRNRHQQTSSTRVGANTDDDGVIVELPGEGGGDEQEATPSEYSVATMAATNDQRGSLSKRIVHLPFSERHGSVHVRVAGMATSIDFRMPNPSDNARISMSASVVSFPKFHFQPSAAFARRLHKGIGIFAEESLAVYLVSPSAASRHAYIVFVQDCQKLYSQDTTKRDVIVNYQGLPFPSPIGKRATRCRHEEVELPVQMIFREAYFRQSRVEYWLLPQDLCDAVQSIPERDLYLFVQVQRSPPAGLVSGYNSETYRPCGPFTDVKLTVHEECEPGAGSGASASIDTHSVVLAARSKPLSNRLEQLYKEHGRFDTCTIEFYGFRIGVFRQVIDYLYHGSWDLMDMDYDDLVDAFKLASEFGLQEMLNPLLNRITFLVQSGKHLLEAYFFAESYELSALKNHLKVLINKFAPAIFANGGFDKFADSAPGTLLAELIPGMIYYAKQRQRGGAHI